MHLYSRACCALLLMGKKKQKNPEEFSTSCCLSHCKWIPSLLQNSENKTSKTPATPDSLRSMILLLFSLNTADRIYRLSSSSSRGSEPPIVILISKHTSNNLLAKARTRCAHTHTHTYTSPHAWPKGTLVRFLLGLLELNERLGELLVLHEHPENNLFVPVLIRHRRGVENGRHHREDAE